MNDFSEFSDEKFDVKAWINRACFVQNSDEPLERSLAELEMRLQLNAEEIESSLHDLSVNAMRRIPVAVQESYRLLGEIQGMQDQLRGLAASVNHDASAAVASVNNLQRLDKVKGNMESAFSTLREATELSGLFVKVEEVFMTGDLPRVAEILSSMRRSLNLVGDVPEFRAGRQKLRTLEDRLQGLVEGSLGEALTKGGEEESIKQLCALLLAVDRVSTVEQLYVTAKSTVVQVTWEEVSGMSSASSQRTNTPSDLMGWLPRFFSWLSTFLENEAGWCLRILPSHQQFLTTGLHKAVFSKVSQGIKNCLNRSNGRAAAPTIATLTEVQKELTALTTNLAGHLKGCEPQVVRELLSLLYSPVEETIASYGSLEQVQLSTELGACPQQGTVSNAEELLSSVASSSKAAFSILSQAVGRCLALTGGTEFRSLLQVVDKELSSFLVKIQASIQGLHAKHTGASVSGGMPLVGGQGDDSEEVSNTLLVLLTYADLAAGLSKLEAELRKVVSISNTVPKLLTLAEQAPTVEVLTDPVSLRIIGSTADTKVTDKLKALLDKVKDDPRFMALPGAAASLEAVHGTITTLLSDALLSKVKNQLKALPNMPEWSKSGPLKNSSPVVLPSFHAYPLPYITSIGEYLMTMPQQLEVLMAEEESAAASGSGANVEELAAEWLDRVVTGAANIYVQQIMKIPELGLHGGLQLAADVEYFCNVISALHGAPPSSLLTVQLFAGQPNESFSESAAQAIADGGADQGMLRALAAMRKIALS
ncbi:hypothetical protein CEUSTIGMA_g603.t1 [Chlamydomonas eustigma]|uniref:Conserved oligomeric Golgi complex subunit 7 n=1 Tax=Chlamydomonas eustigma TaxID=1157962 RepID=A0A250WRH8_9CHLO|nr:hypothetical protein CEUSTIGMA_g603.t1 [Chlamydomonas eustigma]|eukprot:GAX73150.1 hypothetical protein CEUSTIGMA_g603.t1 [Chlamydomonas eustigma]